MKKWLMVLTVIFLGILFISASQPPLRPMRPMRVQPPLYFIPNQGQVHETAAFYAKTPGYTLWMTKEGLTFDSIKAQAAQERKRDVSQFLFLGANKNPEIVPMEPASYTVNYLKGSNPSQWKTGIPTSKAVLYKALYKNIDLKVYGVTKAIEYDWLVKPGGDPGEIHFQYKNVKETHIDENG
ncbi:MAG: hypothetical protein GY950_22390, partial [bacterium]|nr:hypothetical protein [bacterium]